MAEFDDEYDDNEEQEEDDYEEDEQEDGQEDEENENEEDEEDEENDENLETLEKFDQLKKRYRIKSGIWPFLSISDKMLCNKVKKIDKKEYDKFMKLHDTRVKDFSAKARTLASAILPILPYILIALVVIIAIAFLMSAIIPQIAGGSSSDGMSSPFGVKGDCFYGVRTIYRDVEQAKTDLRDDYVDMLSYTISNYENSDVTLNIQLPADDYNFANFKTGYEDAYNMVLDLAQIVYSVDNSVNVETVPENLDELLAGIKYFGVDADFVDDIAVAWAEYVFNNSLYTAEPDVQVDQSAFSGEFENLLLTEFAAAETNRTEMFYVKDYIFEDKESYAENIPQKDYVAYIFMPKKAVKVSFVSFAISEQAESFKMFLNNNGNMTEFRGEVFYEDEKESIKAYQYELETNITTQIFADLDVNNAANGESLYKILHNLNAEHYLSKAEGNYYTFKNGALEVTFENGAPFSMAEFETDYEAAAQ